MPARISITSLKKLVPWRAKMAAKLILARLPLAYGFWQRLGLFQHGGMGEPAYALDVFRRHFERIDVPRREAGFVALELGPGDSLFSAMTARAFGASRILLVDTGPFARGDLARYRAMSDHLIEQGLWAPPPDAFRSLETILEACGARYETGGVSSLRRLPEASVDFIFSQAVLEHVRRSEFVPLMAELRRVLRPDGVSSHRVDLKDHLEGALHNLRFRTRFWENDLVARSGFYTNRIRFGEMLGLFRTAGFVAEVVAAERWPALPTPRRALDAAFRGLPEDDLLVSGFDVVLRPAEALR